MIKKVLQFTLVIGAPNIVLAVGAAQFLDRATRRPFYCGMAVEFLFVLMFITTLAVVDLKND